MRRQQGKGGREERKVTETYRAEQNKEWWGRDI